MSRGTQRFKFTFPVGNLLILECIAIFRFGRAQSVTAYFNGEEKNPAGIMLDWGDDYMSVVELLQCEAQRLYDEAKTEANGA